MIRGLIVTHGAFGEEIVRVVEMIMGPVEGLAAQSNRGLAAAELQVGIREWLDEGGDGGQGAGAVLFIDDLAGSCATAAQVASGGDRDVALVSGVNLAMVLDFVTWRDSLPLPELVRRLVEKGREAITASLPERED